MSPTDTARTDPPKNSREAEREVEAARADLRSSIEEIEARLSPEALVDDALSYLRGDGRRYGDAILREAKANPLAAIMIGTGVAWLLIGSRRRRADAPDWQDDWRDERRATHAPTARPAPPAPVSPMAASPEPTPSAGTAAVAPAPKVTPSPASTSAAGEDASKI
jgi:hypothetical protein